MNRTDFLASLRSHLNGRIDPYEVESNVEYYSSYIDSEIAKGRSEEDIMEELGQPSLIARTLIDSVKRREGLEDDDEYNYSYDYTGSDTEKSKDAGASQDNSSASSGSAYRGQAYTEEKSVKSSGIAAWKVFAVIGVILLLLLVIFVFVSIFALRLGWAILRVIWPVILIIVILGIVARVSRR